MPTPPFFVFYGKILPIVSSSNRDGDGMVPRYRARALLSALCGLVLLASLLGPRVSAGQTIPASWQPLDGPGGRISHLAGAADGRTLYAVSVTGVNRREDQTQWRERGTPARADALYVSTDSGATWQPVTNDLPPGPIAALHVEPDGATIYVALNTAGEGQAARSGLWRSPDRGLHWAQVRLDRDDLLIRTIVRSPSGPHLFLGAVNTGPEPRSYVYRLTDGDATWRVFEVLRTANGDALRPGSVLAELVVHPAQSDTLCLTTYGGDVLISSNAGESWRQVSAGGEASGPARVAFAPNGNGSGLLVRRQGSAGTARLTLERSRDHGLTWQSFNASGLPATGEPRSLAALSGGVYLLNTSAGTYRTTDDGLTWQPLEGVLSSGGVAEFLFGGTSGSVVAATGYGLFSSQDSGALWSPLGEGLPANSKIAGLLSHPARPDLLYAVSDNRAAWTAAAPPVIWRSLDEGRRWQPAAAGLPDVPLTAWAIDPLNPDRLVVASWDYVAVSADGGLSWQTNRLESSNRQAIAIAAADPQTVYLGGRPALRSTDGGRTWQPVAVRMAGEAEQPADVTGLAVDPADARHLWASLATGVYESRDGGETWQPHGLDGQPVRWLALAVQEVQDETQAPDYALYAGVADGGLQRWAPDTASWQPAQAGLPAGSTLTALAADPVTAGLLWAARDGGGVYRSEDGGATWTPVGTGVGDNLGQALAINHAEPESVFLGTAAAGVWVRSANMVLEEAARATSTSPAATRALDAASAATRSAGVDARIEVVWPHDWAPVESAQRANIGLRLFMPRSLALPACGWRPRVSVWRALDMDPAEPLGQAVQRTVDGQPFPYWELNDVDVSRANDPNHKLYFLVRVEGVDTATSVWAHGADPRTYFPQQDVPSGIASGQVTEVDARIQIVWPHDEAGNERPVTEAGLANVVVAFFKHGTRLSVPVGWQPEAVVLHGAWNQEVGKRLSRAPAVQVRQAGAITYPVWEFNDVPVGRATDSQNRLYMWVTAEGVLTYPTIWAHGADLRTFFPAQDEPVMGCLP